MPPAKKVMVKATEIRVAASPKNTTCSTVLHNQKSEKPTNSVFPRPVVSNSSA